MLFVLFSKRRRYDTLKVFIESKFKQNIPYNKIYSYIKVGQCGTPTQNEIALHLFPSLLCIDITKTFNNSLNNPSLNTNIILPGLFVVFDKTEEFTSAAEQYST